MGRRNNNDDDFLDEFGSVSIEDNLIQRLKPTSWKYIVEMDDDIALPENYRRVCQLLREVNEDDEITFEVNSHGGYVHTAIQLYHHLMETKAKTIAEVHMAYSAASMLALACDEIRMSEFSSMMMHSISFGTTGKVGEIMEHTNFVDKLNNNLNEKIYKTFLTNKEIKKMMDGHEFYLTNDEVVTRLKKWIPIRRRT